MKNSSFLVVVGIFSVATGCSTVDQNTNLTQSKTANSDATNQKFAVIVGQVGAKNSGLSEYCFLQLQGLTEANLKAENFANVKDVVPIHDKSISADLLSSLKSPELRRSVNLQVNSAVPTKLMDLKLDLQSASARGVSKSLDCISSAEVWKGQLGLASEERAMQLSWTKAFGFCLWACSVVHSVSGPHEWPTRSSTPWTLPSYPSRYKYRQL